jgi:broad specificity phosphatase PhoE
MRKPPIASICLLSITCLSAVRGLSTVSSSTSASFIWSESAVQLVKKLSITERAKLLAEDGAIFKGKPIHIRGERVDDDCKAPPLLQECDKDGVVTKIVHFQRHGQGYHNLMGDILREAGIKVDIDSMDPTINPWIRPEIVDSPLTETGKWQCAQQQPIAKRLNPELVVVSPLTRTLQTATISFAEYCESDSDIPWVAHEYCREEIGVLTCNKRRPLSEISKEFPHVDFVEMADDYDSLWNPHQRESNQSKGERIYDFLVEFLSKRPESSIALVTHSAWLFHALNAVIDCGDDLDLSSWFLTGEIRSVKLTFSTGMQGSVRDD